MRTSATLAFVFLPASLWCSPPGAGIPQEIPAWQNQNGAAIYVLENAAAQARQRARMNKGARESLCLMKNVELKELIDRLEHGERVTLEEVLDAVDGLLAPQTSYQPVAFARCD